MARNISKKIVVDGTLLAQTPLHVGGAGSESDVDLTLARDGRGRYVIPGTSLAGPLRHWLETRLTDGKSRVEALFGYQVGDEGNASRLLVEDAVLSLPPGLGEEIRDGIAIERQSGTAADKKKYTRAVLPRGTKIPLKLELELSSGEESEASGLLALLLEVLRSHFALGAAKTRGLGSVKLDGEPKTFEYDYAKVDDLFDWIERKAERKCKLEVPSEMKAALREKELTIEIEWEPASPLMVKAGYDGLGADMLPLVSGAADGNLRPVLPGSSLKGVFRSQAETIVRSLAGLPAFDLVADIFGSQERAGRLTVEDVYQGIPMDLNAWLKEDENTMESVTAHEDHVAIDRFTGGASEGALYSCRPLSKKNDWQKIRLHLDFGLVCADDAQLTSERRNAEIALLLFVLRDLAEGGLPIGFATRRGMGELLVKSITFSSDSLLTACDWHVSEPHTGLFDALTPTAKNTLEESWNAFLQGDLDTEPAAEKGGQA